MGAGPTPTLTRREPLCLSVCWQSLLVLGFSIWLEQRLLVPGSWVAWRVMTEQACSGQGSRTKTHLPEALVPPGWPSRGRLLPRLASPWHCPPAGGI